jgi:hypothetical protein
MKVEIQIRCNRCRHVETVVTESWQTLKTSCGCAGPYTVLSRQQLPDAPEDKPVKSAKAGS